MTDRIGAVYIETDTKLSWSIELGANSDENQIRQHITDRTDVVYIENEA